MSFQNSHQQSQNIQLDFGSEEDEKIEEEGKIVVKYTNSDTRLILRKPTLSQIRHSSFSRSEQNTEARRAESLTPSSSSVEGDEDEEEDRNEEESKQKGNHLLQMADNSRSGSRPSFTELKSAKSMYHNRRQSKIQEFEQDVKSSLQADFLDKYGWEYAEQVEKYMSDIQMYKFIGTAIDKMHVMSFGHSTMSLINYFLSKKMVIMISMITGPLSQKINVYKLEKWHEFTQSKSWHQLLLNLQNDCVEWTSKMQFFLNGVNKAEITSEKILKLLTEDIQETAFHKSLQESYAQIFRVVIKSGLAMGQNQKDPLKQEEIYKSLYRIVLCLFIHDAFSEEQIQHNFSKYLESRETQKIDFEDFDDWIEEIEVNTVYEEIMFFIKKYCGKKVFDSLNTKKA